MSRFLGGVILALANGVPVVSAGITEHKAEVGGRVAYTGVGIDLKTSQPTVEQLRTAIFSILRDPRAKVWCPHGRGARGVRGR